MTPPLPLEEAQARLLDSVQPLGAENVQISESVGRWLAEDGIALRNSPEADVSAMDGFATAGPGPWALVGESAAGHPLDRELASGEAARISTGALVPFGCDGILIKEEAALVNEMVSADAGASDPAYIRRAGFDFSTGDRLLRHGEQIGPANVALATMAGIARVLVGRLPRLALIDTGDELVTPGTTVGLGQIPTTNGPMLAGLCAPLVEELQVPEPIPDDPARIVAALGSVSDADVIVTTGGASVGDHDHLRPALDTWGAELDFWRIAIRPGKPLLVARRGRQTVVGLPGNPVSAYVTALLFVLPLLRRLAGAALEHAMPRAFLSRLAEPAPGGGRRREFLRGKWTAEGVIPLLQRDSSAIRTLADADVLIDRAPGAPPAAAGDLVRVISIRNGGMA